MKQLTSFFCCGTSYVIPFQKVAGLKVVIAKGKRPWRSCCCVTIQHCTPPTVLLIICVPDLSFIYIYA